MKQAQRPNDPYGSLLQEMSQARYQRNQGE